MAPLPDKVRHEFAALALGYYASGRAAFRMHAGALVSAHLLHHAVEFALKATLARHTTLADMKKFGHRLKDLYTSASSRGAELRGEEHRETAALLHELWEMRFPDRILTEGTTVSLTLGDARHAGGEGTVLELGRVDRLFCAAFRAAGLKPMAFVDRMGPEAWQSVLAKNPEQEFLSTEPES